MCIHQYEICLPGWQKHLNPSSWSTHIPCTQGDDSHSFKLCWHSGPVYPAVHSHLRRIEENEKKKWIKKNDMIDERTHDNLVNKNQGHIHISYRLKWIVSGHYGKV